MGCKASRPQPKPAKVRCRTLSQEPIRQNADYRDLVKTSSLKEGKTVEGAIVSNESRQAVDHCAAAYNDLMIDSSQKAVVLSEVSESIKPAPMKSQLKDQIAECQSLTLSNLEEPLRQTWQEQIVPVNLANIPHTPCAGLGQPAQQPDHHPLHPQQQPPRKQTVPIAVSTDISQNRVKQSSEFARTVREHQRIAPLPPGVTVLMCDYKNQNDNPQQHRRELFIQPHNRQDRRRHHRRRKHTRHHRRLNEDDTLYEVGTTMPIIDVDYNDEFYRRKGLLLPLITDKPTVSANASSVGAIQEEGPKFTAS